MKKLVLVIIIMAIFTSIFLLFHLKTKPLGQFWMLEPGKGDIYQFENIDYATLSPDKKWLCVIKDNRINIFAIESSFKIAKDENAVTGYYPLYPLHVFWVGDWLIVYGLLEYPLIVEHYNTLEISGEGSGIFTHYKDKGVILGWNKKWKESITHLPVNFNHNWRLIATNIDLYSFFVPGYDGKTIAILDSSTGDECKGFLYSISTGRRLRAIRWKGVFVRGQENYFHYPKILIWDKNKRKAWSTENEYLRVGPNTVGAPTLIVTDFDGNFKKLNGKHKKEWLHRDRLYAQPSPDKIAVIIVKSPTLKPGDLAKTIGSSNPDEIWLAHYSTTKKIWEEKIPWKKIRLENSEIIAITPDGKGLVFQDGIGKEIWKASKVRVWIYRVGKQPKLITYMSPIEEVIGWLDNRHLLVIMGKKRFISVIEIPSFY